MRAVRDVGGGAEVLRGGGGGRRGGNCALSAGAPAASPGTVPHDFCAYIPAASRVDACPYLAKWAWLRMSSVVLPPCVFFSGEQ